MDLVAQRSRGPRTLGPGVLVERGVAGQGRLDEREELGYDLAVWIGPRPDFFTSPDTE